MPPITVLIKPASSLCNMRCKYCFYADVSDKREVKSFGIMSDETLEVMVRKIFDYADDYCGFAFQGGEPTLAGLDFYKKLIELQNEYNTKKIKVQNSLQTNGYIIDDEWAEFLAKNNFLVGLSLDGYKDIHNSLRIDANGEGTFDKVMNASKLFDKYKVEYNILCVVNNFVARHSEKVYAFFKKNNFKYLQFIPCLDGFDAKQEDYSLKNSRYLSFLKIIFNNYYSDFIKGQYISVRNFDNYIGILAGQPPENCAMNGVCTCYFVVEGDGSVYPCDFYVLDEYKLGNINSDSFEDMLKTDIAINFVGVSKHIDENCKECKWLQLCRGGCKRNREPCIDGKPSLNIYCSAYKEFFEYSYMKMTEILKRLK